jgi:hypothetical protein
VYDRYRFDLAIPLTVGGNPVAWFRQPFALDDFNITLGTTTRLQAWKKMTRRFMDRCEKINVGTAKEENTISALHHNCNHEMGTPCPPDTNIFTEAD